MKVKYRGGAYCGFREGKYVRERERELGSGLWLGLGADTKLLVIKARNIGGKSGVWSNHPYIFLWE